MRMLTSLEFMKKHLKDSTDDDYALLCKQVISDLEKGKKALDILLKQYPSIDDYEQEKNKLLETL